MSIIFLYILKVSLGSGLVWAIYRVFLKDLTYFHWNRFFLLAGLFLSITIPLLTVALPWINQIPVQEFIYSLEIAKTGSAATSPALSIYNEDILHWITAVYFIICLLKIVHLGIGIKILSTRISKSRIELYQGLKINIIPGFRPASIFGRIIMPSFSKNNPSDVQIFLHESEHIRLGHSWDLLFIQVCKSLLWINPFIYLIQNSLKEIHEFQADRRVVRDTALIDYCRLLLTNLMEDNNHPILNSFNQFQTKNRIIMMNKQKSAYQEKWKYLIGVPAMVLMLTLFSYQMKVEPEKVAGTWVGSIFEFMLEDGPKIPDMIEGGKNLHINGQLELNEDQTFKILDPQGNQNGS
ncbi:MAG TPA: M56 family metallopeptidase, partial [Anditalea sp.]|nr:M56 family metallopeptidase [Anditalea sp.]